VKKTSFRSSDLALQARAIAEQNPTIAISLVKSPDVDIDALQRVVLQSGNADDCFWFAKDLPAGRGDLRALERALLAKAVARADATAVLRFATEIPGASADALGERLAEIGAREDIVYFRMRGLSVRPETIQRLNRAEEEQRARVPDRLFDDVLAGVTLLRKIEERVIASQDPLAVYDLAKMFSDIHAAPPQGLTEPRSYGSNFFSKLDQNNSNESLLVIAHDVARDLAYIRALVRDYGESQEADRVEALLAPLTIDKCREALLHARGLSRRNSEAREALESFANLPGGASPTVLNALEELQIGDHESGAIAEEQMEEALDRASSAQMGRLERAEGGQQISL